MATELDLKLLPFFRVSGEELPTLPGLFSSAPPRRAARGRENDHLIVYVSLGGNTQISATEYSKLTISLAERFYQTPGALTSAMRSTAEALNQALLDRNLRTSGRGQHIIGRLIMAVLRGGQFFLIQCGPTFIFLFNSQATQQIHDPQISGRGLGLSQITPLYFSQIDLNPGDLVLFSTQLPSEWKAALQSESGGITLDALRRKLVALSTSDSNAVLMQAQKGNGQITILEPGHPSLSHLSTSILPPAQSRPATVQTGATQPEQPLPPLADRFAQIASETDEELTEKPSPDSHYPVSPQLVERQSRPPQHPVKPLTEMPKASLTQHGAAHIHEQPVPHKTSRLLAERKQNSFRVLAKFIRTWQRISHSVSRNVQAILPRLLPGLKETEQAIPLSNKAMFVVAIAIPLIIVVIANVIYANYGRAAQFKENYDRAMIAAVGAIGQSDQSIVRQSWETTLYYLDKAESHQVTQQSQALRTEAQKALDEMDGITRINFGRAIIGGLSRSIQITRMSASDTDLYMLVAGRGNILRSFLTNQGYQIDLSFACEPGMYSGYQVGTLIDVRALPRVNAYNATVMAIDASGTLLYCAPGKEPQAVPLASPNIGWQRISAFYLDPDNINLYILDAPSRAVWIYAGNQGQFLDLPILFFSGQIPSAMEDVIDLAANGDDLYLLHQDGKVTICTLSRIEVVPTRCTDPATYIDSRPGYQNGTTIPGTLFTQVTFATPPDPSLYFLESQMQALYRFSPRTDSLILQGQLRTTVEQSKTLFTSSATAMAISPSRYLFICIGNQIYFATDVP